MLDVGESKVHNCLRANLDKLSDACRKEEISLSVLQASNTELMPNIANACKVGVILGGAHMAVLKLCEAPLHSAARRTIQDVVSLLSPS